MIYISAIASDSLLENGHFGNFFVHLNKFVVDFVELDVAPTVASEPVVAADVDASVADDVESEST